jgi:Uma2 family endonuclease
LAAINVRVGAGRILIPDIAVIARPGLDVMVCDAADVVLVVEVTSLGNMAADRAVKPQLYAQAGIAHYVRIEMRRDGPEAFVYRLEQAGYVERAHTEPGQPLMLEEPFKVTLDLAALAAATRSSP